MCVAREAVMPFENASFDPERSRVSIDSLSFIDLRGSHQDRRANSLDRTVSCFSWTLLARKGTLSQQTDGKKFNYITALRLFCFQNEGSGQRFWCPSRARFAYPQVAIASLICMRPLTKGSLHQSTLVLFSIAFDVSRPMVRETRTYNKRRSEPRELFARDSRAGWSHERFPHHRMYRVVPLKSRSYFRPSSKSTWVVIFSNNEIPQSGL